MPEPDVTPGASMRVDVWLWAVRMFRARSAATAAAKGGHVHVDGARVKPASKITAGQTIRARTPGGERILVVRAMLSTRAGAPIARQCYEDRTPPPDPALRAPVPRRDKGMGRPTKKDRRDMDRLRGRSSR
ncbi:MAG: RNA-binding S4 domain-containing protein [Brevibacterium yomogidense]|nr:MULTISPECIES: S4 domain-containing protein [Brevibacterium]